MKVKNSHAKVMGGVVRVLGTVVALFALVVMAGWVMRVRTMVQLFPAYAPMQFNTGLCFLLCSVALLFLDDRRPRIATVTSAAALIFATLTLFEYLFDASYGIDTLFMPPFMQAGIYHHDRMAPNTTFAFICTAGILLFCSLLRAWDSRRLFAIALVGSLISAQGIVPLLGYFCGVTSEHGWGIFTSMTAQSACNFFLLGTALTLYAWKKSDALPLWLPVPVCIGLVLASVSMAQVVRNYEASEYEDTVQFKARTLARNAEIYLTGLYGALDRIGTRWEAAGGTPRNLWESDVAAYLKDYPFISGISWINTKTEITWPMPLTESSRKVIGFNLSSEPRRAAAIAQAIATRQPQTTREIEFLQHNGRGFLYVRPLFIHDRFDGAIVAVIKTDPLFSKLTGAEEDPSFFFTIHDQGETIWSTAPEHLDGFSSRMLKNAVFHNRNNEFTVSVIPKSESASSYSSSFSSTVLLIGLLVSLLITWSLASMLKSHYATQVLRDREELLKQALGRLYASERIKQAILDGSKYSIISTDTDGVISTFNQYASEMLGYSPEEMIGKCTPQIIHDEQEVAMRAAELSAELGEPMEPGFEVLVAKTIRGYYDEGEWTYIRKDGTRFPVLLTVTALRDEHQHITGFLGIAKDITEAREASEALRKSEENFRSSFENTMVGMALVSPDGKWLKVNRALCNIIGYSPEELLDIDFQTITHPDDLNADVHNLQRMLRDEISSYQMEKRYFHKMGHIVWIMLSVSLVRGSDGKPLYFISQIQDITQRKNMERMKNEFISTVSHELRTPLTSIRGSLGLMRAGIVGEMPAKAREMTDIAYNNAERLILLINDILDIDKIESGQMRFDMKEHDLSELIRQSIEANHAYGEKFNVRFTLEPLGSPVCVFVDGNRLIQVLSNLLSNAAKFSPAGEEVRIQLMRQGRKVRVCIIDKGQGIPEEFRGRIFSKFAQADSSSSRQKSGTGLGLNISKQIIEYMQGAIGFTSKEGGGTTFWIELSEIVRQTSAELHEAIEYLDADDRNFLPYILHAEDDYGVCRIIAQALQGKAIVHAAPTVSDASRLLKLHDYDLLIIDLELPDGTGIRLLQEIEETGKKTRVIILSASEVDAKMQSRVALALVKSKVSEEKAVEYILELLHQPSVTK